MSPIRLGLTPRCPNQAAPGKSRCVVHAAEQRKANRSSFDGFYSSKPWRMARRKQLYDHPLCQFEEDGEECGRIADSAHHIVEHEDGGAPRHPANLLGVCRSPHSLIHAQRRSHPHRVRVWRHDRRPEKSPGASPRKKRPDSRRPEKRLRKAGREFGTEIAPATDAFGAD